MVSKRILVVDDSCLFQRLIADVVNAHTNLEVVGVACNGYEALDMIGRVRPDLITLDILMPEMDGIQTLIEIRKHWPDVRTVMISSLTPEGSDTALDALDLGANEYVVKPPYCKGIADIREKLQDNLVPKLEALCGLESSYDFNASANLNTVVERNSTQMPASMRLPVPVQAIAIGVSTGGPDALGKLLSELPADLGVPIVIVQHMPAEFTVKLAKRLNAVSALEVVEAKHADVVEPGHVYIAPGDYHMVLEDTGGIVRVCLNKNPPENSCRPSVDPLFRSVSSIYADQGLGLIMTGMGQDGLRGAEALYAGGSAVLVQDEASSIVWGMPKLVAMAGLADEEVPLQKLAAAIMARVRPKYVHLPAISNVETEYLADTDCVSAMGGATSGHYQ